MYDFIFQNTTKIYFGEDQLKHLTSELQKYGNKVLFAYGGGSIKKIGLYDEVMNELRKADFEVFEFGGIEPNPRHTTVNRGADICKKEKIDVILAVGGGSTIDCSKVIASSTFYDGDSWDLVTKKAQISNALPLVTILTFISNGV